MPRFIITIANLYLLFLRIHQNIPYWFDLSLLAKKDLISRSSCVASISATTLR